VDEAACAVSFDATENCRSGDVQFAALHHDGFIEGSVVPLVVFSEVKCASSWPCPPASYPCLLAPSGFLIIVRILHDVHTRQHDEPLLHYLIENRHKGF
jgi:hypothetical protein